MEQHRKSTNKKSYSENKNTVRYTLKETLQKITSFVKVTMDKQMSVLTPILNQINESVNTSQPTATEANLTMLDPATVFLYLASQTTSFKIGDGIALYYTPIVVIIGLVGNSISLKVMTMKHNRRISCCVYMAAVAVVDNGMLLIATSHWVIGTLIYVPAGNVWGCKEVVYMFHLFSLTGVYSLCL